MDDLLGSLENVSISKLLNGKCLQLSRAWEEYDGDRVAQLLSLQDPHVQSAKLTERDPETILAGGLDSPLNEMTIFHLRYYS